MVSGPAQKMIEAVTNPSMNRARPPEPSQGVSRRCSQPPSPSSRSSSRSSDPTMPPTRIAPSTISSGALSPTAAAQALSVIAAAEVAAISSVTRPSPSVTTLRVRSGSRCPTSTPMVAPRRTVTTLTSVPNPMNTAMLR